MTEDDAKELLSEWRKKHQDEVDLLKWKLAAMNASLAEMLRRAEKAEAERDEALSHVAELEDIVEQWEERE